MIIRVLGSAAGGGFPQWNCNCTNCAAVRRGEQGFQARTQSSIAISTDQKNWLLLNASPEITAQIAQHPPLQPSQGLRDSGIKAVMLMDSQIDHTTGLLSLRESQQPLPLYCTGMVRQDLSTGFPLFDLLNHYCGIDWQELLLDGQPLAIPQVPGIEIMPVAISGKAPPYSPHRNDPHPGDNLGITVRSTVSGKSLFYAPGLGNMDEAVRKVMSEVDCLLVDGTFWTEDEMTRAGVGTKPAAEMGHLPQSGPDGMINRLRDLSARKILIHINNTNPILNELSDQRRQLQDETIEVAYDGMLIDLVG